MTEKVVRALEGLKHLTLTSVLDNSALKKEKTAMCVQLADQISSSSVSAQSMPELTSRAIESLVRLCDDSDVDVRAVADESLNRVIRVLTEVNVLQVQVVLYKEIKKNGSARCVRTALTKFAALINRMRPSKGRGFVGHIVVCILALASRTEESVLETVAKVMDPLWTVLGPFAIDSEVRNLLKAFLQNLSSDNAVIRRSSATSLAAVVSHSRKPAVFTSFAVNILIDKVVPVTNDTSSHLLSGTFICLRTLLPLLNEQVNDSSDANIDKLLQIYELSLHYTDSRDHNIVTAALETLNQLLTNPCRQLKAALLHPSGITRSFIHIVRQPSRQWARSVSEVSVAGSVTIGYESLLDEGDVPFQSVALPEQTSWGFSRLRAFSSSTAPPEEDIDSDSESVMSEAPSLSLNLKEEVAERRAEEVEDAEMMSKEGLASLTPIEFDKNLDVGSFTDAALPILFCCRKLSTFLLDGSPGGIRSDKMTRVSVKSIALSCFAGVIQICPQLLTIKLTPFSDCEQRVTDVLNLSEHADPQLRGVSCMVVGCFLHASLVESMGRTVPSLDDASSPLHIQRLLAILDKALRDESPGTSRLALSGVRCSLSSLLSSEYSHISVPLLTSLLALVSNSYWLNKVRLLEVLSELDYVLVGDVTGSQRFQNTVVEEVLLPLLNDVDDRVRRAAAEGISRVIPKLWGVDSTQVAWTQRFARQMVDVLRSGGNSKNYATLNLSLPYSHLHDTSSFDASVTGALSKLVSRLAMDLAVADSKYRVFGVLEALRLLSEQYPPVLYMSSWHCHRQGNSGVSCLLALLVSLVTSSANLTDLAALDNATTVIAYLYAGHALCAMKTDKILSKTTSRWPIFGNDEMAKISDDFLTHLLTVLNIYTQLLEFSAPVRPTRLLHLLPSKKGEKDEVHLLNPHYLKLQINLKSSIANYKMCIEENVGKKLVSVLSSTLLGLSSLLEMSLSVDSSRIADEILSYMRVVVTLQPFSTITVVLQLLRSLFGVNLPHFWAGLPEEPAPAPNSIYANTFQILEDLIKERVRRHINGEKSPPTVPIGGQRKLLHMNPDMTELSGYVRMFEPMVITALKLYTVTGDVDLQCLVLTLLTQLVLVKVNYCLLDDQLTFNTFVKKQFDLIERGQIKGVERLLPKIFKFFLCLSSEKPHSKPLMTIPDIMQLFVGLMACDQPKNTHCVPGLMPVVVEVFLPRQQVGNERKEAETQKEVLMATLLRLTMHHEVLDALCHVLTHDEQIGGQVIAKVLPLVAEGQLDLEEKVSRRSLANLLHSIPLSMVPADSLLKTLFLEPRDRGGVKAMTRWLSGEALLLETLVCLKEDAVLSRLMSMVHPVDLTAFLAPPATCPDPLLVAPPSPEYPPAESLARMLVLAISRSVLVILENPYDSGMLEDALHGFFVAVFYLLQSGTYHQTAYALQAFLQSEEVTVGVTQLFMQLSGTKPLLTCQYLNLVGLLLCPDPRIWGPPLRQSSSSPLRLVQKGCVVVLADYLSESPSDMETMALLLTSTKEVLSLYEEPPVRELLTHGAQRVAAGPILLEALTTLNTREPHLIERALRVLKAINLDHSGLVIRLLVAKFLRLPFVALSRVASGLACRRLEYLLLLPQSQVLKLLPVDGFRELRMCVEDSITKQRHATLTGLVTRLGKQAYQEAGIETAKEVKSQQTIHVAFNEEWFYLQVKQRCCREVNLGTNIGDLLLKLSYPYLQLLFAQPNVQISVLTQCFNTVQIAVKESREKLNLLDMPMYKAAKESAFERVQAVVSGSPSLDKVPDLIWSLGPVLTAFLEVHASKTPLHLSDGEMSAMIEFSLYRLQRIAVAMASTEDLSPTPSATESALLFARTLLEQREAQRWLCQVEHRPILDIALRACVMLVRAFSFDDQGDEFLVETQAMVLYLSAFLLRKESKAPHSMDCALRRTVMLLCRLPPLWSLALAVPETMDVEAETLHLLSLRVAALGWTTRSQFEEIWAAFLTGFSQDLNDPSLVMQTGIEALEGIAVLMEGTLLTHCGDPGSKFIQHSRDIALMRDCAVSAPRIDSQDGFQQDLESLVYCNRYRPGLLSVEHLWSATQLAAPSPDLASPGCHCRQQVVDLGLDITSCLHFLLDLYKQWTSEVLDQRYQAAALKTSLVLSDQFTDPAQFRALLDVVLNIEASTTPYDVPLLPLCILVTAKCLATLLPGVEYYARLKVMMCRSDTPAARLATLQGLLYLVQSPVVYWRLQPSRQLGNSMFYVEDNEVVTQLVEAFIPLAVEVLLHFAVDRCSWSEVYEANAWALLVYLLQHYRNELVENREQLIQLLVTSLSTHKGSPTVQTVILHGVERLLLADSLDESHVVKVATTAQLLIGQPLSSARSHGYQLLLTASFISKRRVATIVLDPDTLMAAIERLGLLLSRLRRSAPNEVSQVTQVLRYLLRDLQPLDVLTKLIQEFLSPHHPYTHVLASLLFQVMEDADLPLLQDWVVFSLPSLVHGISPVTGSRTLTCLFLSACRDPWLRAAFPLTLTRGIGEPQNPQLLTVAAAHFYSQLKITKQQTEFRSVFEQAAKTSPIYAQIANSIS